MAAAQGKRREIVLLDLPQEILEEVLCRLPLDVIRRCLRLSKRIYSRITSFSFYERWIAANLRPELFLFSSSGDNDDDSEDALANSIHSLTLSEFDQPLLPHAAGIVQVPNPLQGGPDQEKILILYGSAKGLLLLGVKDEEEGLQTLHVWNPFLRVLGPAITLPPRFEDLEELQVGFGHSQGEFYILLISPLVEAESGEGLFTEVQFSRVCPQFGDQLWTVVRCPHLLLPGSVLCHQTTNSLNDETVLWSVRNGPKSWSVQGFSFTTKSFIASIPFPDWVGDGARNHPIVKVLAGRVFVYRAATGDGGDDDPIVVWSLGEDGNWDFQAQFDLVEDFVGEDDVIDEDYHPDVTDSFREVFAVTPGQDRLFVYTSDDHLMGFDPNTSAYFYFGERGNHLEAIDEVDSPELPDLRVASYHPSFIWPYTRFAGEDN